MFPLGEGGQPIVAPAAITTFTPETQIHKYKYKKVKYIPTGNNKVI